MKTLLITSVIISSLVLLVGILAMSFKVFFVKNGSFKPGHACKHSQNGSLSRNSNKEK